MENPVQPKNTLSSYLLSITCAFAICMSAQSGFAQDDDGKDKKKTVLEIGSKAPDIDIEHWISDNDGAFEHVTEFEKDKVYVLEFWQMRWLPSIATMPHIAKMQEKYEDRDVQIISICENDLDTVEDFLEQSVIGQKPGKVPKQTYADLTNSYCLTSDPDGSAFADYFIASEHNQIPCAFIIGKTGKVEWIGTPLKMEKPLEEILADKWDREEFKKEYVKEQEKRKEEVKKERAMQTKLRKGMREFQQKMQDGEEEEALEVLGDLIEDEELSPAKKGLEVARLQIMISKEHDDAVDTFAAFVEENKKDGGLLNEVTWSTYELFEKKAGDVDSKIIKLARKAAQYAVDAEPESGAILDTLAHYIYIVDEDLDKAIEVQKKAVEFAGIQRDEIKPFLDELMREKETGKKKKKKRIVESDF